MNPDTKAHIPHPRPLRQRTGRPSAVHALWRGPVGFGVLGRNTGGLNN